MERSADRITEALSNAVDAEFYSWAYGELAPGTTAAEHYASVGWREMRDPNPWFSTSAYLEANPELLSDGIIPLYHFLRNAAVDQPPQSGSQLAGAYYARLGPSLTAHPSTSPLTIAPARTLSTPTFDLPSFTLPTYDVPSSTTPSASVVETSIVAAEVWGARDLADLWRAHRAGPPRRAPFPDLLFDADYYAGKLAMLGLQPPASYETALEHFLREGIVRRIVPTPRFDESFYRKTYPDIAASEWFGYAHFILHGMKEGRRPSFWFDPYWYKVHSGCSSEDAGDYAHFLSAGIAAGYMPCSEMARFIGQRDEISSLSIDTFDSISDASQILLERLGVDVFRLLVGMFVPEWQPPNGLRSLERLAAYLRCDVFEDVPPGPLFNGRLYSERARDAGFDLPAHEAPLMHWLTKGVERRIVPTERFSEPFYCERYVDIAQGHLWAFEHFVHHGASEGRLPTPRPVIERLQLRRSNGSIGLPPCYRRWIAEDSRDSSLSDADIMSETAIGAIENRLLRFVQSPVFNDIMGRAEILEPGVGSVTDAATISLPPLSDWLSFAHARLQKRLQQVQYDTVICVPWIRMGGADLVAGHLSKAILRLKPDESALVLITTAQGLERPEWFPRGAEILDISDLTSALGPADAERLLYTLLIGVSPQRVFNVNSLLCWKAYQRFGKRLAQVMHLYGYLFCWDRLPNGTRVGYPSEYFPETFAFVRAFLTDTLHLKNELSSMYALSEEASAKIVPTFMPVQSGIRNPSVALMAERASRAKNEKVVFWAGRFDAQKRFDLFLDIARLMPDTTFHCWGKAVMDSPPDLSQVPLNVTVHEPYRSFEDLPLNQADAWLFTSGWEGMPNTLLEVAANGFPTVASAVGGVPELITAETGWPIEADAGPEIYASALREIFSEPKEALRRVDALQARVEKTYNVTSFDASLKAVL